MVTQHIELISDEVFDGYINQAAKTAGYEKGFGIDGCDLSKPIWWAAYCRQSLDQQAQNNRVPEYLLTLAKLTKEQGVFVPREYIFYDHETGEHLDRPAMSYLRHELIEKQKLAGVFFADLRCLSREPAPQQVFERVCEILGVRLIFGDAPNGIDVGSQFARSALTFSNKLTRLATHRNARAGNIGRILKGWVPSQKATYGYRYRRDVEIQNGKVHILKAWWELDSSDDNGNLVPGSPADTVAHIFHWAGNEGHGTYWIADKLNEMGIRGRTTGRWIANGVCNLLHNHCYTGKHKYNAFDKVPNPKRPLGDITGAIRRTILRPKPEADTIAYSIPQIVSEELWQKANQAVHKHGRGMHKRGSFPALLRNRIMCPRCGRPMVVKVIRYKTGKEQLDYHCSRVKHVDPKNDCTYRRFIPGGWDESVWDCVYTLLKDTSWLENKLSMLRKQNQNIDKLVKVEQQKVTQSQAKIARIQEGYEGGLYNLEDAKTKISRYQEIYTKAEKETERLNGMKGQRSTVNLESLRNELVNLAKDNLDNATYSEKLDILAKAGIKVYPSEDLKTMKIKTSLGVKSDGGQGECRIVEFAFPIRSGMRSEKPRRNGSLSLIIRVTGRC